jgi:hypothetical protein
MCGGLMICSIRAFCTGTKWGTPYKLMKFPTFPTLGFNARLALVESHNKIRMAIINDLPTEILLEILDLISYSSHLPLSVNGRISNYR